MRPTLIVLLLAGLASARAEAYTHQSFYGWSPDGSFYGQGFDLGTTGLEVAQLCLTNAGHGSRSWPEQVPAPTEDCADLCERDEAGDVQSCQPSAKIRQHVTRPKSSARGPAGERIAIKAQKTGVLVEVLSADGKHIAQTFVEIEDTASKPRALARSGGTYWRSDSGAVAVLLGASDEEEAKGKGDGFAAPRYLAYIAWKPTNDAPPDARAAAALNVAGMKRYKAKDTKGAAAAFARALVVDPGHVLARYNLACVTSLRGDAEEAGKHLLRLTQSDDPLSDEKLAKAASDPDLKQVVQRDEIKGAVSRARERVAHPPKTCAERCRRAADKCVERCPEDEARACGRECEWTAEACEGKCPDGR